MSVYICIYVYNIYIWVYGYMYIRMDTEDVVFPQAHCNHQPLSDPEQFHGFPGLLHASSRCPVQNHPKAKVRPTTNCSWKSIL